MYKKLFILIAIIALIVPTVSATTSAAHTDTYSTVGTFNWTAPSTVKSVTYLVVGGGGGGGPGGNTYWTGGGGGAGGVLSGSVSVSPSTNYTVTVGNGGVYGISTTVSNRCAGNGGNSVFSSKTSYGGGAGGGFRTYGDAICYASNGGSGGGAGSAATQTTSGTSGQGNYGASSVPTDGGGGGGCGSNGTISNGGSACSNSISGSSVDYGLGGNGAPRAAGTGASGTNNRGNGGGGGGSSSSSNGGSGATGIVILYYITDPVVALFTVNQWTGVMPLEVAFTDTSLGTPTSWSWNFGDGLTSSSQNPIHIYSTGGSYTVTLTVSNALTSDSVYMSYIVVGNKVSSPFSANITSGIRPLAVEFTDTSLNATSWTWNFGDGNTSTSKSPTRVFNISGNWTINHSASNTYDTSWTNKTQYINISNPTSPTANLSVNISTSAFPISVTFNGTSLNETQYVSWNWSFGDGFYSNQRNTTHTFATKGAWNVSYKVTNFGGFSYKNVTINATDPAYGTWDSSVHSTGDTGVYTYTVDPTYWDTVNYAYAISIYNLEAELKASKAITSQTGIETFSFDDVNYPIGYYYAYITRTRLLPGETAVVLNTPTQTQIAGIVIFTGYVKNSENGTLLNANVSIVQIATSLVKNQIASTGAYDTSPTAFLSGQNITINVTLANYRQSLTTFTPSSSKTYNLNISLTPNNPTISGSGVGGIWGEYPYNKPIPSATVTIRNATYQATNTTNAQGYYRFDNLVSGTYYEIYMLKTGYAITSVYNITAV